MAGRDRSVSVMGCSVWEERWGLLKKDFAGGSGEGWKDFAEEQVDGFGVAYDEHMTAFPYDVSGGRQADGENLVEGTMYMIERLGYGVIVPNEDGIEGPAYEAVVSRADHFPHESPVLRGAHEQGMLEHCAEFQ